MPSRLALVAVILLLQPLECWDYSISQLLAIAKKVSLGPSAGAEMSKMMMDLHCGPEMELRVSVKEDVDCSMANRPGSLDGTSSTPQPPRSTSSPLTGPHAGFSSSMGINSWQRIKRFCSQKTLGCPSPLYLSKAFRALLCVSQPEDTMCCSQTFWAGEPF